jgi:hypothetical protein
MLRISGEPPSANGASSMHLWWSVPHAERLVAIRATLEVVEPPSLDRLYFWALQATFTNPDGGAAHLGLQHNRRHPGFRAANFGGYAPRDVGGLLPGAPSPLPSAPGDDNTRDYAWQPFRKYRLAIERVADSAPPGMHAWRGSIDDVVSGASSVVRVLYSRGEYLHSPVVWTEAFGRCDHPPVVARWSNLEAEDETRGLISITEGRVNYQAHDAGGCDNTDMAVEDGTFVQRTATERIVGLGSILRVE